MFIVIAILAFGLIIAIHELGHFISARLFDVKVNEFAIGMGPKLLKKQGKETLYTLRAIPFGGFCSMEGEHEEGEEPDPRSFLSQKRWKRVIILASGSIANFVAALLIVIFLTIGADGFRNTTISYINDFPTEGTYGLLVGDTVKSINGERLYYANDFFMFMQMSTLNRNYTTSIQDGEEIRHVTIDFVIERDGQTMKLENFPMTLRSVDVNGESVLRYGISVQFEAIEATFIEKMKVSFYQVFNYMRMIRLSLAMLFSGSASLGDVSGPVGIVSVMNTVGQQAASQFGLLTAILDIISFAAFIGVNVAVINLLPIPAMDGGRILFTFITWVIEKTTRKKLDPKYEGYINTGAFVVLIGLMIVILYNDVARIIGG